MNRKHTLQRFFVAAFLVSAATLSGATAALAADDVAGLGGKVVPGLCLLSREAVLANAKVSKAANERLATLLKAAQEEIAAERAPIDRQVVALRSEAASLKLEERQRRSQALAEQLKPVTAKAELRSREIDLTRKKALQQVSDYLQPVIADVYRQRDCGLLVDRKSVLGGNLSNDLTADVVRGLDARVQTITFEREHISEE
ncbi:MAG: OmpH family outer membrane protein [Tsuneonella suprasediminis]|nr:OmpH family outer membrane protein [Altererythrobacter sp. N1]